MGGSPSGVSCSGPERKVFRLGEWTSAILEIPPGPGTG